ncbi:MAG: hypothetical protein ACD_56C00159G0010 [uncultured bacterium]|nr:MAG: hypothetical protein ACD_56C00159G0010 [uncultured bacterium]
MKKISRKLIDQIESEAKGFFTEKNDGCHDWSHVQRVTKIAMHIGKIEKADLFVLEISAILHDISREHEIMSKGKSCHAIAGSKLAVDLLAKYKIDSEIIQRISRCIVTHRNRTIHKPQTIEEKILFDADKLDAIGAVGIGRVFMFAGITSGLLCTGNEKTLAKNGNDLSFTKDDTAPLEYEKKLKFVKDKMLTKEGKRMARERHEFMKTFFERFWKEVEGKI